MVESVADTAGEAKGVISEHMEGVNLYLDPSLIDAASAERIRKVLQDAVAALPKADAGGAAPAAS